MQHAPMLIVSVEPARVTQVTHPQALRVISVTRRPLTHKGMSLMPVARAINLGYGNVQCEIWSPVEYGHDLGEISRTRSFALLAA